jgi:hypothetical protein
MLLHPLLECLDEHLDAGGAGSTEQPDLGDLGHRLCLTGQRHRDEAATHDDDERSSVHQPSLTE